jgi:Ribbon-helix-helix protein, copG family
VTYTGSRYYGSGSMTDNGDDAFPSPMTPSTMVTVRVPHDEVAALTAGAEARGLTRSQWMRRMIYAQNEHDRQAGRIAP